MTDEQMKDVLDQIIETKYKENSFFYENPIKPEPRPPATEADLAKLDKFLAAKDLRTPPAYRQFLSIYNGIQYVFDRRYSLLSASEVIGAEQNIIDELADEFPGCSHFIIGAGNTPEFTAFDVDTAPETGDYEVSQVSADTREWRSRNFEDFLTAYLSILQRNVRSQEEDRKDLKP